MKGYWLTRRIGICTCVIMGLESASMDANAQNAYSTGSIDAACTVVEGVALPEAMERGGHVGGMVDGNMVIAGGTNWNKHKDTKYWLKSAVLFRNGGWIPGPDLPKALAYASYASDGAGLYVAGGTEDGKSGSREGYKMTLVEKDGQWQPLPPLPMAITNGAGAILGAKFYIAGGLIDSTVTDGMWVLDTKERNGTWKACKPIPGAARMYPLLLASGAYLYLIGGLAKEQPLTPLNDIYRYDPVTDEWTKLIDLPLNGYAWSGQPIGDERLIITGRAYGKVDNGIWIINLKDMSMNKIGECISPATTAPLIPVGSKQWWLVGGEPDSNKNRTGRVSVIGLK